MKNILLFVLFFANYSAFATTTINVKMPGAAGIYARVQAYDDFINYQFQTLDSTFVANNDRFSFTLDINKTKLVFVQVRFIKFKLYVEPNKTYNINTSEIDFSNSKYYPVDVVGYLSPEIEYVNLDSNDINFLIQQFNIKYSEYIDTNYIYLIRGQGKKQRVESFEKMINDFKKRTDNQYFHDVLNFELIKLKLMTRYYNKNYLIKNVFNKENIKLNNHNYMDFFNEYWGNYLLKASSMSQGELGRVVNERKSYAELFSLVKKDTLLKDSLLIELIILQSLPAMYVSRNFDKEAIQDILFDISSKGTKAEIRKAARNILSSFKRYNEGNEAPEFKLFGLDGEIYTKKDFKGKYTYIMVWNLNTDRSFEELRLMKELNADFDDIINFVCVSIDATPNHSRKLKNKYDYDWKFLFYNIKFIDDYNVDLLPHAYLLDKEGNFISKDAPLPTDKFRDYFMKYLNEKNNNLERQGSY